jgi:hypothetical protein
MAIFKKPVIFDLPLVQDYNPVEAIKMQSTKHLHPGGQRPVIQNRRRQIKLP